MSNVMVDIDGVLADFEGKFCRTFQYHRHRHLIDLAERMPWKAEKIAKWVKNPEIYKSLEVIELGVEICKYLDRSNLDICLVSSRPKSDKMMDVTVGWLMKHRVPWASLSIGAGDKIDAMQRLKPVMVIDDIPGILENAKCLGIFGVIFDQPWNKSARFPRISKISDLPETCQYLEMEFSNLNG